jgi:hypothetical protein
MFSALKTSMVLLTLVGVAGCAQDGSSLAAAGAGAGRATFADPLVNCPPYSNEPACPVGRSSTAAAPAVSYGGSSAAGPDTTVTVSRPCGAGVPVGYGNAPPSYSPGTLSGEVHKHTFGH